jgi:hypothetical protein
MAKNRIDLWDYILILFFSGKPLSEMTGVISLYKANKQLAMVFLYK